MRDVCELGHVPGPALWQVVCLSVYTPAVHTAVRGCQVGSSGFISFSFPLF